MKNLKNLLMLLVSILTMSVALTSCNTDSDDYSIAPAVNQQYMQLMSMNGPYSGKTRMHYITNGNRIVKYDSTSVCSWSLRTDSTLTIHNFPVSCLDSAIVVPSGEISAQATTLRELQKAISNIKDNIDIKGRYYIPNNTQYISNAGAYVVVNPIYFKQTLTYEGKQHDVYFVFYYDRCMGFFNNASVTKTFEFPMVLASISIDKEPTDYTNSIQSSYFRTLQITCLAK